jgi:hypothetical protein
MNVLIVFAVLAGAAGLLFLSQATTGVGLIGFGCLLAILARIAQAAGHQEHCTPAPPTSIEG